jgi:hypothetical protein
MYFPNGTAGMDFTDRWCSNTKTLCRVGCHRNHIARPNDLAELVDRFCPKCDEIHKTSAR